MSDKLVLSFDITVNVLEMYCRQLLNDCGIGLTTDSATDVPVVGQHRVLIFCQLKGMLDIVEQDLFR